MISAALFDLDGTLVETEELKALSHARSVAELRPEVEQEEVISAYSEELVGRSRQEVSEELVRRFDLEERLRERAETDEEPWQALVRIRRDIYEGLLEDPDLLYEQRYPHNIQLLEKLRGEGYPTACATMSHREQAGRVLRALGVEDYFDVVVAVDDVERGKPGPEMDLLAARELGVPPEELLVVEDSPAGVEAAIAAGMAVIAVPTDITRKKVRASGLLDDRWVVEDPERLPEIASQRIEASGGGRPRVA